MATGIDSEMQEASLLSPHPCGPSRSYVKSVCSHFIHLLPDVSPTTEFGIPFVNKHHS